jgi:hypothetical protein
VPNRTVLLPGGVNQDALQKVGAYIITPGFFQTLNIPMLRGRDFTWNETQAGLIVSRSLAAKLWPNEDAIGKRLLIGTYSIEVIGVAGNVKNEGLAAEQTSAVYVPMFSSPRGNQNLFIRVRGNPDALLPALREAVWSVDPNQAIRTIQTMRAEERIDRAPAILHDAHCGVWRTRSHARSGWHVRVISTRCGSARPRLESAWRWVPTRCRSTDS